MRIIGWIRAGDKTACGGSVVEGLSTCTSLGVPVSFQGARIACPKNCVIAEGFSRSTLANGRIRVLHGMMTSAGCPLYSTINDIDGVGNATQSEIPNAFILGYNGQWVGNTAGVTSAIRQAYDEQFMLLDANDRPLRGTYYTEKLSSGEFLHGETDGEGKTQRFFTSGTQHIEIHLGHREN